MNDQRIFILEHSNERAPAVLETCIATMREWFAAGNDLMVRLSDVLRTLDQNAAMWPALRDFADQVRWKINGEPMRLEPEDWKDILTAAFEGEARVTPAWNGDGFVLLGVRTSKYGKRRMGEFLSWLRAEGDNSGVRWSAPAREKFDEFCGRGGSDE